MPAYVVVNVTVRDPGRYVVRGGPVDVREGGWSPSRLVILEFPSVERARAWWDSPEYAEAKAVRQSCADTQLVITEGLSA